MKEIMERINDYNGMIDYVSKEGSWVEFQKWSQTVDAIKGASSVYTGNCVRGNYLRSDALGEGSEMVELLNVGDENRLEMTFVGEIERGSRITQLDRGVR